MELVNGDRLADLISRGTGLRGEEIVRYGMQMAAALEHAHQHGVIHRDLKGANVMVTRDGRIKVLDFGLARRHSSDQLRGLAESRETIARPGVVAGTLSAMAPELLRGNSADARSDIWALGVLLYEMAAGTQPFAGATGFELSGAILHEAPAPLRARFRTRFEASSRRLEESCGTLSECLGHSPCTRGVAGRGSGSCRPARKRLPELFRQGCYAVVSLAAGGIASPGPAAVALARSGVHRDLRSSSVARMRRLAVCVRKHRRLR